ncbi:hypothetical protein CL633_02195 [bacterium]|nr:hypothetical protein [bacterium]|tara:strand:+ start:477 stop:1130 length:654 start_codon:yes stop_codon:yes gene_type:complete
MLKRKSFLILIAGIASIGIIISYFPFYILANGFVRYGYWLVFVGTFLEGEAVLLVAGFVSYLGEFNLWSVILIACLAIILGDNFQYYMGMKLGKRFLKKFPCFKKLNGKFNKHSNKILLASRFMFGMRMACITMAGANRVNWKKFFKFNALSGVAWVMIMVFLGYAFGASFILLKKILKYSALSITVLIILAIIIYHERERFLKLIQKFLPYFNSRK